MARDATSKAQHTYNTAENLNTSAESNAANLYNTLTPAYTNEVVNPQGFGTKDIADMTTAAEQSEGGTLGAVEGKANQTAAANRNAGSFAPALDEASRSASRRLSNDTLNIKGENALLKEKQRQGGLEGLNRIFNTENQDVLGSIGLETGAVGAETEAGKSGWFQNMLNAINSGTGFAKAVNSGNG